MKLCPQPALAASMWLSDLLHSREEEALNIFLASLKHHFGVLFVSGLAKDQGSPICAQELRNTPRDTKISGY